MVMPAFYILVRRFPSYHRQFPYRELGLVQFPDDTVVGEVERFLVSLQTRARALEDEQGMTWVDAWARAVMEWGQRLHENRGVPPRYSYFPHPSDWTDEQHEEAVTLPAPGPRLAFYRVASADLAERLVETLQAAITLPDNPRFDWIPSESVFKGDVDYWDLLLSLLSRGEPIPGGESDVALCRTAHGLAKAIAEVPGACR
jgi:hypothetical protein